MTTRWLDAQEQQVWRSTLEGFQLLSDRLDGELDRAPEGGESLSLAEYEVLVRLSEAQDWSARMSELADDLVHSRSRLTHTVSRMQARGLVDRRPCASDRRGVLCVMTDAGWDLLRRLAPRHVTGVREHLFDVADSADLQAMGRVMAAVRDHLRALPPA